MQKITQETLSRLNQTRSSALTMMILTSTSTKPKAWVRPRTINQNITNMTREMQKELEEKYFRECGDRAVAEEMAQMDYDADQASSDYYPHYDEGSREYWF